MSEFVPTPHPILPIPTAGDMMRMGEETWLSLMKRREEIIARERHDPIRFEWEPPVWKLCDALLEWPWVDRSWAARVRKKMGIRDFLRLLLILGGNRGSKSRYAARCMMKLLLGKPESSVWIFHSNHQNSVEQHQSLMWELLPAELRRTIRSQKGYISYTQKYGFSDDKLVLPNGAACLFRNYEQDIKTLEFRIATRSGRVVSTFTPILGYTGTVKLFLDGARTAVESTGWLLPKDGGPEDWERALDLERFEELLEELLEERTTGPVVATEEGTEGAKGTEERPAVRERRFEKVPRVMQCFDGRRGVVFFHTSDNPFAPPRNVADTLAKASQIKIRERWYGIGNKVVSTRFPRFDARVHVVRDVPAAGTNYLIIDPASGRNFWMHWLRVTPESVIVYREWPGNYEIPGVGVPEPWALPDGKHLDGKAGRGQDAFGFGLVEYKQEIARLEGWKDGEAKTGDGKTIDLRQEDQRPKTKGTKVEGMAVEEWGAENGAREVVAGRWMDSRFASAPRLEADRPVTLLEEFGELNLWFEPTPGDDINEGVALVNDWLYFDADRPVDFWNKPRLYVHESCVNTIFALQNWTGRDGAKGACKDPIDTLRYAALLALEYQEVNEEAERERREKRAGQKRYY